MFDQLRANEQRMWQLRDEENGVELVDTDSDQTLTGRLLCKHNKN